MGCFTTCFSNCNPSRRRRRRRSLKTCQQHPSLLHHLQNYQSVDDFRVPQLIKQEEENDTKGEEQEQEEVQEEGQEGEEIEKNAIDILHDDSIDEKMEKANRSGRKKVTFDLNVKFYENWTKDEEEMEEINEENRKNDEKKVTVCQCGSDSSSSLFSYPLNHRYQNSRDSDDEFDDILSSDDGEYEDADDYCDEDEDEDENEDEQSSESLFSLSLDSRKHKLGTAGGDKEVNSPLQGKNVTADESGCRVDRGMYVDSVLNPVENLTQWKGIKARSKVMSKDEPKGLKENRNSVQDFSFPVKKEVLQGNKKEIAVDTSLSTWLVGSEKGGSQRSNSNSRNSSVSVTPNKFEDRPILGALTVEEIRQMSASSTPRKSPGRSRDDMPIIGSVGSYWSRTGQTTDSGGSSVKSTKSRYRESAEVIWDSTPFEARLEKALEKEANSEGVFAV